MSNISERKLTWSVEFKENGLDKAEEVDKKVTGWGPKMQQLGGKMGAVGATLTKRVTLPALAMGTAAVKSTMDFDDGMARVKALTGATGTEFDELREKAKQLGNDTMFSAQEAAEGMQVLAAAGVEQADIMEMSSDMFALMAAGSVDADTAASVLTNTMSQYNLEATDSQRITDAFTQASSSAKVNVDQLEHAMALAGASMASMNMSIEESTAAVGHLANAGVPAEQTGAILNAMSRDMKNNAGDFEALGVNVYDASGKMRTMGEIMGDVEAKTSGMTDAQRDAALATVFSGNSMRGATAWLSEGSEEYSKLKGEIEGAEGATKKFEEIMGGTLGGSIRSLKSSLGNLAIEVGDILGPKVDFLAKGLQKAVDWFNNLNDSTKDTIVTIGLILTAAGPILALGGKIIAGMSLTKLAIAGLIVVGVLLYKNWDKIKEKAGELKAKWDSLREAMSNKINGAVDVVKDAFNASVAWVKGKWDGLKGFLSGIVKGTVDIVRGRFQAAYTWVRNVWDTLKIILKNPIKGTVDVIKTKFAEGVKWVEDKWNGLKKFLKNPIKGTVNIAKNIANKVTGKGHRTGVNKIPYNEYPAKLHKGEMVLTKSAAEEYRSMGGTKDSVPVQTVNTGQSISNQSKSSNVAFEPTINISVNGNADSNTVDAIARETQRAVKQELEKAFVKLSLQGV